jgi:hypothetical protein
MAADKLSLYQAKRDFTKWRGRDRLATDAVASLLGPGAAQPEPMTGNLSEELTRLCTIPEPAMFLETMGIHRQGARPPTAG